MNDLETGLRNSLKRNLDPIDATPLLPDDALSRARSRRFISMLGMGIAAVALAAVTVWTTSELSSNPSQPPVASPPSGSPEENGNELAGELVVGSIEKVQGSVVAGIALRAIDLETGESRKLEVSDFNPGDAQFSLIQTGTGFVFRCGPGVCVLDNDLQGEASVLGKAWCLSPSATEGQVWLAILDPDSPDTVRSMKSVQEMTLDGQVLMESELPPDRWHCPVGAVNQAVLFQEGDDLVVWDAEAREVVYRLPGPFPADTHGDLVAWCDQNCKGGLHLTDIGSGEDVVIEADQSFRFEETYDGAFSPDGSLLALPVAADNSFHARQVAVINVQEGTARLIENLIIHGPMAWASSGNRLFIDVGEGKIAVYDAVSGDLREILVDVPEIFAMAAS